MALKIFNNPDEAQCATCEYGTGTQQIICRKQGAVMQASSKCKKYKYDPLKREPKTVSLKSDYSKEDFEL